MSSPTLWERFFPPDVDFYGLLLRHAEKVHEGVEAFARFLGGLDPEDAIKVRAVEKEADELRRQLRHAVLGAFSTPIDREDLFFLSRRMDEVINYAKHTIRDIQILEIQPAESLQAIGDVLVEGSQCIVEAIRWLPTADKRCGQAASDAKRKENDIAKLYPRCLKSLYELDDMREILKQLDLLRTLSLTAERIDEVADVILHIIIKEA